GRAGRGPQRRDRERDGAPRRLARRVLARQRGGTAMTVRAEADGPVLVVTIDRPERRNAIDGPTAVALTAAFRAFEADDGLAVGVLTGASGTFCAGADLKAIIEGWGDGSEPVRTRTLAADEGPMGPTRMLCSKPVIAAV